MDKVEERNVLESIYHLHEGESSMWFVQSRFRGHHCVETRRVAFEKKRH